MMRILQNDEVGEADCLILCSKKVRNKSSIERPKKILNNQQVKS